MLTEHSIVTSCYSVYGMSDIMTSLLVPICVESGNEPNEILHLLYLYSTDLDLFAAITFKVRMK